MGTGDSKAAHLPRRVRAGEIIPRDALTLDYDEPMARPNRAGLVRDYWWAVALAVITGLLTAFIVARTGDQPHAPATPTAAAAAQTALPAPASLTPAPMVSRTEVCKANTVARLVLVSLDQQHMWLCQESSLAGDSPITSGSVDLGNGTPVGTWQIEGHETDRYLWGPDYRVFVHYWLPFFGDFGFHDSPWQTFPYGDLTLYKRQGSRGCIHVPPDEIATLFEWALDGTQVTITSEIAGRGSAAAQSASESSRIGG